MDIEKNLPFLKQLARALAVQFGSKCEITVHDLTDGLESTIVAIENGHITGRKIGDGPSRIVIRALHDPLSAEDSLGYLTRTQDGRLLRSSSLYIRDDTGKPVALLGINYDFTELSLATSILTSFTSVQNEGQGGKSGIETIYTNVNNMMDCLIEESLVHVGKPVALMDRDDKVKAIKYLDERGAFLVKKSGDKVSNYFGISKYTLYSYLNIGDKENDDERN
ncbi:MAG: helix-turn-helix transcriptional regulator [Treponema sp.]|nr:helix-turn-helix transcriptional regulator [Treponema sp.]